jgi:hypothetical protein
MLLQRYVPQPTVEYLELVRAAGETATITDVAGAFAYGTRSGAGHLLRALRTSIPSFDSASVAKRWLLGIDWCRTEPETFDVLAAQANSKVRVHHGAFLVDRAGCTPELPWHPKALLFRGSEALALIVGSGNMSTNGLTRGHEAGSVTVVVKPKTSLERSVWDACAEMFDWFDDRWTRASTASSIAPQYVARFKELVKAAPPITDADTLPVSAKRWWTEERIRKVRSSAQLWIDAGNLHENRGKGNPGNQLMLKAMTRVFFGFAAEDLERNSTVGYVAIRYHGTVRESCSLRYSDNGMDVLTLPVPDHGGPPAYDQQSLLFSRTIERGRTIYELTVGTSAQRRRWAQKSRAADSEFRMQSGREWGVFP